MARLPPKESTIKQLFAFSGNQCAMPDCNDLLIQEDIVIGEICHIEAANPKGPRYNKLQNNEDRRKLENLILFCPKHHKLSDNIVKFPVDKLKQIKEEHEKKFKDNQFVISEETFPQIYQQSLKKLEEIDKKIDGLHRKVDDIMELMEIIHAEITVKKTKYSEEKEYSDFRPNPLLESETYNSTIFDEQIIIFNNQVCLEYQDYPSYRPLINNFTKLKNGGNHFVKQRYRDKKTHEMGEDIFSYVKSTINEKISEFKEIKNQQNQKSGLINLQNSFKFSSEILTILKDQNIVSDKRILQRKLLGSSGLSNEIIDLVEKESKLSNILRQSTRYRNLIDKAKDQLDEIDETEQKIKEFQQKKSEIEAKQTENSESDKQLLNSISNTIIKLQKDRDHLISFRNSFEEQIEKNTKNLENSRKEEEEQKYAQKQLNSLNSETKQQIEKGQQLVADVNKYLKIKTSITYVESQLGKLSVEKLIPIIGDYGSGKSALCNHIMNFLCYDDSMDKIPIFVPLGELDKKSKLNLKDDIYSFITKEYHFNIEQSEFFEKITNGDFIFILDALDEMSYKLDSNVGQKNLERVIELASNSIVILTSRHTYLSNTMTKYLFVYDNLIEVLDFEIPEIEKFLAFQLRNETELQRMMKVIKTDPKIGELAKKPLFLNVIRKHFDTINNFRIINESIILTILTDEWIEHDAKVQKQNTVVEKEKLKKIRKKISEILAFAKPGVNETISIDDVKMKVKEDLGRFYPDVLEKLKEYYHDAINSTFLVKEENETYRFLNNPIREFFVARGIVNDINNSDPISLLEHIKKISSEETFIFIKGLIDIEWAIKPHVVNEIKDIRKEIKENFSDSNSEQAFRKELEFLENHENKSFVLMETIKSIQELKNNENVGSLLRILHITGNMQPKADLNNLNISEVNLIGANFSGMNLSNSNFSNCNLRGSNFINANLSDTDFTDAELSGSNFEKSKLFKTKFNMANVDNANFEGLELDFTDFTMSNLTKSNLNNTKLNHTKFRGAIFIGTKLGKMDFRHMDLQSCVFLQTQLSEVLFRDADLTDSDFRGNDLKRIDFTDAILKEAKLNGTDLTNAVLHKAKLHRAKLNGAILDNTDLTQTELNGVKDLPIPWEEALNRGALF